MIAIKKHRGEESFIEDRHLEYLRDDNHPRPTPIEEYMRAIGDIKDTTGITYHIDFPVWPNRHGHFGRVNTETHSSYESMVAPIVIARRIVEDLLYTHDQARVRNWNVPNAIVPEDENAGLPTRNLIGWASAATLTTEQRQLLESAGLVDEKFNVDVNQFQFNRQLFSKVSDFMKAAERTIKLGASVHESERGSLAQVPWQIRDTNEDNPAFNRHEQYCEGYVSERTYTLMDRRFAMASLVTSFRVRKDALGNIRPYCCYDFNNYAEVTDAWHLTRNNVYAYGGVEEDWNSSKYRSVK